MPRYEFDDGKSKKFWEITVAGDSYTVCYGRIGTDGQSSTKVFSDNTEAQAAADKITASKVKKGYQLVDDEADPAASSGGSDEGNSELEMAIKINPNDLEAWQVYADYLQSQNDSRGEMIALGIAIEQDTNNQDAKKRFDELFNLENILGKVAKFNNVEPEDDYEKPVLSTEWKYGYAMKVRAGYTYDYEGPDTHELLKAVIKKPVGNFVQEIVVGITEGMEDGEASFSNCIRAITNEGKRESVKKVIIGDFDMEECEISWSSIGDCGKLYNVLPNLESLKIHGGSIKLGKLEHEKLKSLIIETGGLPAEAVKALNNAKLPNLEYLEVWFGAEDYGAEGNIGMIDKLLKGEGLPKVSNLGLRNSEFENDIAQGMVQAPILKQLKTLDLSMGTMTDVGAQAILDNAQAFEHLDKLSLADNFISNDMQKSLKSAFGDKLNIGDQETADEYDGETYYYVSVGE